MSRVKTFDSTGIAPGGVLFAGDLNNIQDHYADLNNLSQTVQVGSLVVGAAGLALSQFATGILRISGALRVDSVVNAITGFQVNGTALSVTHLSDGTTGTGAVVRANGPTFTGIPHAPTASPGDSSDLLATTAFVAAAVTAGGGGGGSVPSGAIVAYAGVSAPTGWLLCDGSEVSRATYSALFTAISTLYGAGNGTTTFNLPDMRGRIPVGKTTGGTFPTLGATGGEEAHSLTVTEMPSHAHSESAVSAGTPAGTISSNSAGTPSGSIASAGAHTHPVAAIEVGAGAISDHGFGNVVGGITTAVATAQSAGAHTHTFTGTALGTHNHTFSGSALPTHSHVIANTGGGQTHNNLQPYVVTNYIIKT